MGEYTFPDDYKATIQVIVNPEEKTLKIHRQRYWYDC